MRRNGVKLRITLNEDNQNSIDYIDRTRPINARHLKLAVEDGTEHLRIQPATTWHLVVTPLLTIGPPYPPDTPRPPDTRRPPQRSWAPVWPTSSHSRLKLLSQRTHGFSLGWYSMASIILSSRDRAGHILRWWTVLRPLTLCWSRIWFNYE